MMQNSPKTDKPPHVIRLRHPWKRHAHEASTQLVRSFNWPRAGASDDDERVELIFENADAGGAVFLNGALLGETPPDRRTVRFSIAALLEPHNELMIVFPTPSERTSVTAMGEVRLEIFDEQTD